jgi:hypothetical protein
LCGVFKRNIELIQIFLPLQFIRPSCFFFVVSLQKTLRWTWNSSRSFVLSNPSSLLLRDLFASLPLHGGVLAILPNTLIHPPLNQYSLSSFFCKSRHQVPSVSWKMQNTEFLFLFERFCLCMEDLKAWKWNDDYANPWPFNREAFYNCGCSHVFNVKFRCRAYIFMNCPVTLTGMQDAFEFLTESVLCSRVVHSYCHCPSNHSI